jgi:UDP-N-acetylmuramate dehydrogenase
MPPPPSRQDESSAPVSPSGPFNDLSLAVATDEPLAGHTWLGIGGAARYFCEPVDVDALIHVVRRCRERGIRLRVLGGGSNVLVDSAGFDGMVVRLTGPGFCEIRVDRPCLVAGAGAKLVHVVTAAVQAGLAGLETLVGVPGTIGGALVGNAGGHAGDIGQRVREVTVLDSEGRVQVRTRSELAFQSRWSNLDDVIILACRLELEEEPAETLTKRMQKQWIVERADQPSGTRSVAMMFKDPTGSTAESLITQAAAKDLFAGEARVAPSHANFVIAKPGCTSGEVKALLEMVRTQVRDRLGVDLTPQIEVW